MQRIGYANLSLAPTHTLPSQTGPRYRCVPDVKSKPIFGRRWKDHLGAAEGGKITTEPILSEWVVTKESTACKLRPRTTSKTPTSSLTPPHRRCSSALRTMIPIFARQGDHLTHRGRQRRMQAMLPRPCEAVCGSAKRRLSYAADPRWRPPSGNDHEAPVIPAFPKWISVCDIVLRAHCQRKSAQVDCTASSVRNCASINYDAVQFWQPTYSFCLTNVRGRVRK
jgi:hypothetical protein